MNGPVTGTAEGHDKAGRLVAGHSEWAARKQRLAALVDQLAAEYDAASPVAQQLLRIVATHLDQAARTRNNAIRSRSTRLATRLLDRLTRRPQPPKPSTLDQYIAKRPSHDRRR